jgi:uncharacterized protein (DUF1697 family)
MQTFIALLRGINVGGTGILPMKELVALCGDLGFAKTCTYIQSGNAIFQSRLSEEAVRKKLESALADKMGKKIDVMVRTPAELRSVLNENPFPDREPAKVAVAFLASPAPKEALRNLVTPGNEQVQAGNRAIYVFYPDGMGRSKLKLPLGGAATTVRNINTVGKLAELAEALA